MSIIVALDVTELEEAKKIVEETKEYVDFYKIHVLYNKFGNEAIKIVRDAGGKVFLDLKFHDIPNTVELYARNAVALGVDVFNLHCSGGTEMMKAAVKGVIEEAEKLGTAKPKIIGVTVLTSIDQKGLNKELRVPGTVEEQVKNFALLAKAAGLDGVVCSPQEITIVKEACGEGFLIVTPGIRPAYTQTDDQKRVMTPKEAVDLGSTHLVIGRPITQAENRGEAAKKILDEINGQ